MVAVSEERDTIRAPEVDSVTKEKTLLGQVSEDAPDIESATPGQEKPSVFSTTLVIIALMSGTFLVALDVNILGESN